MDEGNSITGPHGTSASGRQSAQSVLLHKIERKKAEVRSLTIVLDVIPWDKLTDEEEAALWSYFIRKEP